MMSKHIKRTLVVIVDGLAFSQVITLFLTPVLYLRFDELASTWKQRSRRHVPEPQANPG